MGAKLVVRCVTEEESIRYLNFVEENIGANTAIGISFDKHGDMSSHESWDECAENSGYVINSKNTVNNGDYRYYKKDMGYTVISLDDYIKLIKSLT